MEDSGFHLHTSMDNNIHNLIKCHEISPIQYISSNRVYLMWGSISHGRKPPWIPKENPLRGDYLLEPYMFHKRKVSSNGEQTSNLASSLKNKAIWKSQQFQKDIIAIWTTNEHQKNQDIFQTLNMIIRLHTNNKSSTEAQEEGKTRRKEKEEIYLGNEEAPIAKAGGQTNVELS
ncbi:hypothetical protein M5K25_005017 [Dendrobium thyrsiflorum]|uniref:Uncharacterized protein n=1 Tax=Dendrobium thyrsiflorum TaxID=117978 RepID=A0ABD0VGS7_DENTH